MLLRGSGEYTGNAYDLAAIVRDGAADGGVAAGAALSAYADAIFAGATAFAAARERLEREVGEEASVDAVVRVADATGIPLEEAKARMSVDIREALSLDG